MNNRQTTPKRTVRRQTKCIVCGDRPVAMRTVEYCFVCWPGGPVTPPPCLRCGARTGYHTNGLCRRCHASSPDAGVGSCPDCFAWGTSRLRNWLCHGCFQYRWAHPGDVRACPGCRRVLHLGPWGVCRLCFKQAGWNRPERQLLDFETAFTQGWQLFFAFRWTHTSRRPRNKRAVADRHPDDFSEIACHDPNQLALFPVDPDLVAHGRSGLHRRADHTISAPIEDRAHALGAELGWGRALTLKTCIGVRIVLGVRHGDEPIKASIVEQLREFRLPVWTVLYVLSDANLLNDNRIPAVDRWVARQLSELPATMAAELDTWFRIMRDGSTSPRRRPRSGRSIRANLAYALPILRQWAADGHASLREITKDQILGALPGSGTPRAHAGQALRSIFGLLRACRVLFTDPTYRVKTGETESRQPLPVDLATLRSALDSDNPAQAATVALIAFHGLATRDIRRVALIDYRDGRLHLDERVIVLAEPVQTRLHRYLDHRAKRWPDTANPHLFINLNTAKHTEPVGPKWIRLTLGPGLTASALREDRILDEAQATKGDVRRLADLFGLSIKAGSRYTATVEHPDLTERPQG